MRESIFRELESCLAAERLVALATVLSGPEAGAQMLVYPDGTIAGELPEGLAARVAEEARGPFARFASARRRLEGEGGEVEVFIEVHPPRPRLVVVGAVHAAVPLVSFARTLGFRTVVVDPRSAFATPERFAHADELAAEWPQEALPRIGINEATYLALLSHDPKIDLPALALALRSPARYIGALGSKRTHAKRCDALREEGFSEEEIGRIHAPIGLDLGGRRAEEIALAVMAEVVAVSHGIGLREA